MSDKLNVRLNANGKDYDISVEPRKNLADALRETSVLFGTALSVWILKERFGWQRGLGAVVIVVGVVLLRLS